MVSEKQLVANRLNALKSTGPRTPEGKNITRLNAVRDGLTGQLTIVPREEYATYIGFSQRLTADLNPSGNQELHVATRIVRDTWRLHRIAANEENMYTLGLLDQSEPDRRGDIILTESGVHDDPALAVAISNTRTFMKQPRDFERASLYEQRLKRGLHKDYALFRQLQRDRNPPETKYVARTRAIRVRPEAPIDNPDHDYDVNRTAPKLDGSVLSHYPRYLLDLALSRNIQPQVVNRDHPYVSPWPKPFATHPYEIDCDW